MRAVQASNRGGVAERDVGEVFLDGHPRIQDHIGDGIGTGQVIPILLQATFQHAQRPARAGAIFRIDIKPHCRHWSIT